MTILRCGNCNNEFEAPYEGMRIDTRCTNLIGTEWDRIQYWCKDCTDLKCDACEKVIKGSMKTLEDLDSCSGYKSHFHMECLNIMTARDLIKILGLPMRETTI